MKRETLGIAWRALNRARKQRNAALIEQRKTAERHAEAVHARNLARNRADDADKRYENIRALLGQYAERIATAELPPDELRAVTRRVFGLIAKNTTKDDAQAQKLIDNFKVVGSCRHCGINLYGDRNSEAPDKSTMPCGVAGCPFEAEAKLFRRGLAA